VDSTDTWVEIWVSVSSRKCQTLTHDTSSFRHHRSCISWQWHSSVQQCLVVLDGWKCDSWRPWCSAESHVKVDRKKMPVYWSIIVGLISTDHTTIYWTDSNEKKGSQQTCWSAATGVMLYLKHDSTRNWQSEYMYPRPIHRNLILALNSHHFHPQYIQFFLAFNRQSFIKNYPASIPIK